MSINKLSVRATKIKDLVNLLKSEGFSHVRTRGDHHIFSDGLEELMIPTNNIKSKSAIMGAGATTSLLRKLEKIKSNRTKTAGFIDSLISSSKAVKNTIAQKAKSLFETTKIREHFDYHPKSYNYLVTNQHLFPFGAKAIHEKAYNTIQKELGSAYLDDLENALVTKNKEFMKNVPNDVNRIREILSGKPLNTKPGPWYTDIF